MTEIHITDPSGYKLSASELVSPDLVSYVKNLNPKLGTPEDPYYNSYLKFNEELNNNEIYTINPEDITTNSSFDDMDLSGIEVVELNDNHFLMNYQDEFVDSGFIGFNNDMKFDKKGGIETMEYKDDDLEFIGIEQMMSVFK